jgi:hypothetical protein
MHGKAVHTWPRQVIARVREAKHASPERITNIAGFPSVLARDRWVNQRPLASSLDFTTLEYSPKCELHCATEFGSFKGWR